MALLHVDSRDKIRPLPVMPLPIRSLFSFSTSRDDRTIYILNSPETPWNQLLPEGECNPPDSAALRPRQMSSLPLTREPRIGKWGPFRWQGSASYVTRETVFGSVSPVIGIKGPECLQTSVLEGSPDSDCGKLRSPFLPVVGRFKLSEIAGVDQTPLAFQVP